ncbi:hypothetical protein D3C79_988520 [compost metagenome]
MATQVADDDVEDQPDGDADAENQLAEAARSIELVLAELGTQGGGSDLLADMFLNGLEHRLSSFEACIVNTGLFAGKPAPTDSPTAIKHCEEPVVGAD